MNKLTVRMLLLGFLILGNGQAFAGGLWMYEQAASDMGMANAGRAASALDASTAFGNPAAMTVLDRSQLVGGFMGINLKSKFSVDSATNSGGGGGDAGGFTPSGTFAYVHKVNDDLRLGIYSGSYLGLGIDYGDGWSGRYYVQDSSLLTACINPSIGYRLNDYISLGGGVSVVGGKMSTKVAINPLLGGREDGRLKYDDTDIGYGYNLGILLELSKQTRLGLTYRSAVDLDFSDKPDVNKEGWIIGALPDVLKNLKIDITLPQAVMFSVWHQFTPKFALAANLGWQDWSRFGMPEISVTGRQTRSLTTNLDYQDTYHIALGAQYRIAPKWLASAGIAYDTSPIDKAQDRSPMLPLDRQIRYATGLQYELNNDITIGGAFEFIDAGSARINQAGGPLRGELKGEYNTNYITVFNMHVIWKF
jgi:long-chain fatty acid transport protein